MDINPKTGFHYIHIFRPHDVFLETRACYVAAAEGLRWMSVQEDSEWDAERSEWQDPSLFLIFWGALPKVPEHRKARFSVRYMESIGTMQGLIRNQWADLEKFLPLAGQPDLVLVGTPAAANFMKPICRKVAVVPIGYRSEVMGVPDWGAAKDHDIGFYGSGIGRRNWILPVLRRHFQGRFRDIRTFGLERKRQLDHCRAVLYVNHSDEVSFPGMRLWQAISTSAALLIEDRDPWPAVPGKQLLALPFIRTRKDIDELISNLETALTWDLEAIARFAHADLSQYTIERCMEEFLVPATEGLRGGMIDLIVNLTPTGMVPTKEMTPHVPISVEEIVSEVRRCHTIGITMVHLHARDEDGFPTHKKEVYGEIIRGIRRFAPELVICVSLSGRTTQEFEKRSEPLRLDGDEKPDMGSLTLSSLNFPGQASINAPDTVKGLALEMKKRGIVPELEIFDLGMANYANYLIGKGLLSPPYYANIFLGNIAGAQLDLGHAGLIVKELPKDILWSLAGIGDAQLSANALGIAMGGGVRIGLEDSIHMDEKRTVLATNEAMVWRIHRIAAEFGRRVMTPGNLRGRLQLQTARGKYGR